MKELVKPEKLEEQLQNMEAYCDQGTCPDRAYSCPEQRGCPGHYGTSVSEEADILF